MHQKADKTELTRRAILIRDEHGGIHRPNEIYYLSVLSWIAQTCIEAFINFESMAVKKLQPKEHSIAFDELQRALSLAANLSRYFWPSRDGIEQLSSARGKKLRKVFGLEDASALRDRKLRDAIEHFDERLDVYLLDPEYGHTNFSSVGGPSRTPGHFSLRYVDIVNGRVELLGESYDYLPIKQAAIQVKLIADEFIRSGCVFPSSNTS